MQAKAGGAEGGIADPRAELHAMVQDAIARHLSSRGLSRVPQGGDITVGYLVVVASNVTTQAITDYFGYGPENAAIIAKAHSKAGELRTSGPGSRVRDPATYRAGALVVDILDGRTLTLQYRNVAQREMLPAGTPADARAARIRQAVDELLGDLRISLRR
jgi:hypothetical protein